MAFLWNLEGGLVGGWVRGGVVLLNFVLEGCFE